MATVTLSASTRAKFGKGAARKIRKAGSLPGVVYRAGEEASSVSLDPTALEAAFRSTMDPNTLIELDVEGSKHLCLIKDVQRHPVSQMIRHVDLYEVVADQVVTVPVRVRAEGVPAGVKLGGSLQYINRTLVVRTAVTNIPEFIGVDVTPMEIGSFVRASEIDAPKGTEILFDQDFNVLACVGKRGGVLLDDELDAEDAEDAEGAEGAEGEGSADTDEG